MGGCRDGSSDVRRAASYARGALFALLLVAAALLSFGSDLAGAHGPSQAGPAPLLSSAGISPSPSPSDTTPPVTVASGAPEGWTNKPVTVTLTASDNADGSGVASISYSVDGGALVTCPAPRLKSPSPLPPITPGDGGHALAYYATDLAGNAEPPQSLQVRIATQPPRVVWQAPSPGALAAHRAPQFALRAHTILAPRRSRPASTTPTGCSSRAAPATALASGAAQLRLWPRYGDGAGLLPGLYRVRLALATRPATGRSPERAPLPRLPPRTGRRPAQRRPRRAPRGPTFDDGYDKAGWASMLAALHAARPRHLFVNGRYVVGLSNPGAAHHRLGRGGRLPHLGAHPDHDRDARRDHPQIERTLMSWRVARGHAGTLFRPPYGGNDARPGRRGLARLRPRDALERRSLRLHTARCGGDRRPRAGRGAPGASSNCTCSPDGGRAAEPDRRPARARLLARHAAGALPRRRRPLGGRPGDAGRSRRIGHLHSAAGRSGAVAPTRSVSSQQASLSPHSPWLAHALTALRLPARPPHLARARLASLPHRRSRERVSRLVPQCPPPAQAGDATPDRYPSSSITPSVPRRQASPTQAFTWPGRQFVAQMRWLADTATRRSPWMRSCAPGTTAACCRPSRSSSPSTTATPNRRPSPPRCFADTAGRESSTRSLPATFIRLQLGFAALRLGDRLPLGEPPRPHHAESG